MIPDAGIDSVPPIVLIERNPNDLARVAIPFGDDQRKFCFTIALFVLVTFTVFRSRIEKRNLMVLLRNSRLC